jgi:hypothetical protein
MHGQITQNEVFHPSMNHDNKRRKPTSEVGMWRKLVLKKICVDMDVDGWKEVTLIHDG